MFGNNVIHGKSTFEDNLQNNELVYTTTFPTLQGEGPHSGKRCVFIRLTHCNLACSFCDTYFDNPNVISIPDLYNLIVDDKNDWLEKNGGSGDNWGIVVTGGEPGLQAEMLAEFFYYAFSYTDFSWMQVESNGILPFRNLPDYVDLVCSPKCVEKYNIPIKYLQPHADNINRVNYLKFVINADPNSIYHNVPKWALTWSAARKIPIYVSPMNMYLKEPQKVLEAAKSNKEIPEEDRIDVMEKISFWEEGLLDMKKNRANHEYTALLCMRHGFIMSLQTHLLASLP